MPPRLGAHMSIAGGIELSVERAASAGCEALQIFTKSSNQWNARPLGDDEIGAFRTAATAHRLHPVIAHDSYLINVGTADSELWQRSLRALDIELQRCERLGVPYLVMHPGSHRGDGEESGLDRIARALDEIHRRHPDSDVSVLLENTAGQGTNLGYRFEQLRGLFDRVDAPGRLGVCIDTAHTYAAGYDIGTRDGWERTWARLDELIGIEAVKAVHVNDSRKALGSRVDRHEQIGLGLIPPVAFLLLMNDARFDGLPAILETPKTDDGFEDALNLAVLRRLIGRTRAPSARTIEAWRGKALAKARQRAAAAGPRRSMNRPGLAKGGTSRRGARSNRDPGGARA